MHTVIVRVWLPDRPGALGQVASRIGAVRGDVLDIAILETGGGRVVDEIVVALPDPSLVDLMTREVHAIDGVSVEDVRPVDGDHVDAGLLALNLAAAVAEAAPDQRLDVLTASVARLCEASWVVIARSGDPDQPIRTSGDAPSPDWVMSLLAGSQHLADQSPTAGDLFWTELPGTGLWIAAGRANRPIHRLERERLDLLAKVCARFVALDRTGQTSLG